MSRSIRRLVELVSVAAIALMAAVGARPAAGATVPAFDHVFIIMMENHAFNEIIGNAQAPFINSLASQEGLATQSFAVSHPSLPNYLAATGASTFGITTDCTTCFVSAPNIAVDRVEPSGRTWKAYMEDYPGNCFLGDSGEYAQKHDPFLYYDDIRTNPTECARIVPFSNLAGDLGATATTASYNWITPNLIDDMHDGTIAQGDTWLQQHVPTILNSPAFTTQNSLLVITWDEDDGTEGNQVPTIVVQKSPTAGFRSSTMYSHYSLLSTIEQAWGLTALTSNDAAATSLSAFFTPPTGTPPGAPTGVSATAGHHGTAKVTWTPPAATGGCAISSYSIAPSPQTGAVTIVGGTATSATVSGLARRTTYTFTVTATNCAGAGPASAPSNPITG